MQKKVLITGVLGGIGSDLAKAFNKSGYYVIGLDIKNAPAEYCHHFIQFDLHQYCGNIDYRLRMNQLFDNEISDLFVLINNAAVQILSSLEEIKLNDWEQTLNVNLTGM